MNRPPFAAALHQDGGANTRRGAIVKAGAVALLAMRLRESLPGVVKASKKTKRIKTKKCRKQVSKCVASLEALCQGEPTCLGTTVCCELFATCNAAAALPCIFANAS